MPSNDKNDSSSEGLLAATLQSLKRKLSGLQESSLRKQSTPRRCVLEIQTSDDSSEEEEVVLQSNKIGPPEIASSDDDSVTDCLIKPRSSITPRQSMGGNKKRTMASASPTKPMSSRKKRVTLAPVSPTTAATLSCIQSPKKPTITPRPSIGSDGKQKMPRDAYSSPTCSPTTMSLSKEMRATLTTTGANSSTQSSPSHEKNSSRKKKVAPRMTTSSYKPSLNVATEKRTIASPTRNNSASQTESLQTPKNKSTSKKVPMGSPTSTAPSKSSPTKSAKPSTKKSTSNKVPLPAKRCMASPTPTKTASLTKSPIKKKKITDKPAPLSPKSAAASSSGSKRPSRRQPWKQCDAWNQKTRTKKEPTLENVLTTGSKRTRSRRVAESSTTSNTPSSVHDDVFTTPTKKTKASVRRISSSTSRRKPHVAGATTGTATPSSLKNRHLQSHCWSCHVPLHTRNGLGTNGETCFYAMHTHPLLEVPVCCVCADKVYHVEASLSTDQTKATTDSADCCSGCSKGEEEEEPLFLCDSCPRAFCGVCVTQAHGGENDQITTEMETSTDDWACLYCNESSELRRLRHCIATTIKRPFSNDDNDESDETEQHTQSLEFVLKELVSAEEELERCETTDTVEFQKQMRQEILDELKAEDGVGTEEQLQEAVHAEMVQLEKQWREHHLRVSDHVLSLQETADARLKKECGQTLLAFYKNTKQASEDSPEDPEWKIQADRELDLWYKEQGWKKGSVPGGVTNTASEVYDQDVEDQAAIEEISTLEECLSAVKEHAGTLNQWSTQAVTPESYDNREKSIRKALHFEDHVLDQMNIEVRKRTDTDDAVEERRQQRKSVVGGVRRDELILRKNADRAKQSQSNIRASEADGLHNQWRRENYGKKRRIQPERLSADDGDTSDSVPLARKSGCGHFDDSDLVLTSPHSERAVSVATVLAKAMKQHQIDGIRFMWENVCPDLSHKTGRNDSASEVGGCILAHNMGLGKSFQAIALLYTLFHHPSLAVSNDPRRCRIIQTALLVVPTNAVTNWENEFEKWVGNLQPPISIFNLNNVNASARARTIRDWHKKGGVLLVTKNLFSGVVKASVDDVRKALQTPGPDIVVLDEAHTMVRNNSTNIYKGLSAIQTKRRIALTGTPFQNNLTEYYHMASWVRPGCLGKESAFEREFVAPIRQGMASDSSMFAVRTQRRKSHELHGKLSPFVHRRDDSTLRKDLPVMQQAVIHVRQTKLQATLFRSFNRNRKSRSFLDAYTKLKPVHNHPGCLLMRGDEVTERMSAVKQRKERAPLKKSSEKVQNSTDRLVIDLLSDSDDDVGMEEVKSIPTNSAQESDRAPSARGSSNTDNTEREISDKSDSDTKAKRVSAVAHDSAWWEQVAAKQGKANMMKIENGYKVVLLLQILAHADELGDKVLVFSKCLKTLDFIEKVLESEWESRGKIHGPWKKNADYLRIDGAVDASDRGILISSFNEDGVPSVAAKKVFLISIEAGGVGVSLTSANRVVLFDCHWNPAVMSQALHRCYRYGQTKPVFVYRFVTEGSMEEKINSRSVNKSSLAARVIDQHNPDRSFSERDLDVLLENDLWVCCDDCEQWRMLPPHSVVNEEDLQGEWYCHMNPDKAHSTCEVEEKSQHWYASFYGYNIHSGENGPECSAVLAHAMSGAAKKEYVERDEVLRHLVETSCMVDSNDEGRKRGPSMIAKYYFHDALLEDRGPHPDDVDDIDIDKAEKSQPHLKSTIRDVEASPTDAEELERNPEPDQRSRTNTPDNVLQNPGEATDSQLAEEGTIHSPTHQPLHLSGQASSYDRTATCNRSKDDSQSRTLDASNCAAAPFVPDPVQSSRDECDELEQGTNVGTCASNDRTINPKIGLSPEDAIEILSDSD